MKSLLIFTLAIILLPACSSPAIENNKKRDDFTITKCSINGKIDNIDTLIIDSL